MPEHDHQRLQDLARRHLWLHFTKLGTLATRELPVMVRGEGCRLWDTAGRSYLDGLSGLFVVQIGHGRRSVAEAAARQASELAYFPIWGHAHPPAVELAARLAAAAPGDLNRVFFTSGGSEAVESAWKLARQHFRAIGQPHRTKVIARETSYHGTTMGALSITGIAALRTPFEPLLPGVSHVPTTNRRHCTWCAGAPACTLACADDVEAAILRAGPDTVAMVVLEPLQNSGGCIPPPPGYFARVREICDRYGVLLLSDEVICAYGRLGEMFGCERYGYQPDLVTTAKGLTSGYAPIGAVLASDRVAAPFLEGDAGFTHGITFGGHPVSCAVAMANLDVFDDDDVLGNVRANEAHLGAVMQSLDESPFFGEARGAGYFWAVELVRDRDTGAAFTDEEREQLVRGYLAPRLLEEGLICRADDRGGRPYLQVAPPLVAGPAELDEMADILRRVLAGAPAALAG